MANTISSIKSGSTIGVFAIPYATCSTAADTVAKVATVVDSGNFVLETGAMVVVKFTNKNSASNPTLNVNSTGAKPIYRYGTTVASTGTTTSGWVAGAVTLFVYDGTGWVREYWNNTTYSAATTSAAGLMSAADKTKLDGIAAGANAFALPYRLQGAQASGTGSVSDPNSALETGFYYVSSSDTNRPPFSQSANKDYRILTTAYGSTWLQQIATDFRCNDIFYRRLENGTWKDWVKIPVIAKNSSLATSHTHTMLSNKYTSRPTTANIASSDDRKGTLEFFHCTSSMTTGKPPFEGHILHMNWDNTGGWDSQLCVKNSSAGLAVRGCNDGTWGNWATMATQDYVDEAISNVNVSSGSYATRAIKAKGGSSSISVNSSGGVKCTMSSASFTVGSNLSVSNGGINCAVKGTVCVSGQIDFTAKNSTTIPTRLGAGIWCDGDEMCRNDIILPASMNTTANPTVSTGSVLIKITSANSKIYLYGYSDNTANTTMNPATSRLSVHYV